MFDLSSYGKLVSFEVYPVNILGDSHNALKVLSVIDFDTARMYGDMANLAVMVFPSLPQATPKDYTKYKYLKLERADKQIICIAIEWINLETVVFHTDVIVNIRVMLKSASTVEVVRKLLLSNNIEPIDIKIE